MNSTNQPRIALVTRETRMAGLLGRWATRGQAKFRFKQAKTAAAAKAGLFDQAVATQAGEDEDFAEIEDEDRVYHDAVSALTRDLDFGVPVQVIDRKLLPTVDFRAFSVVVTVGQDGLVANAAKYVGAVPIVGVNPDPARIDGVLLPFQLADARAAVGRTLDGRAKLREVTLAQATLEDGQTLLAFNDLFVGAASHVSARYELRVAGREETQCSSGLLVSTGAGSTGWISSVFNMTQGVARFLGGPTPTRETVRLAWEDRALLWAVREPFASRSSGTELVAGRLSAGEPLTVESRMAAGGVIFSDGVQADFLEFNGGSIASIGVAPRAARLVVG